MTMLGRAGEDRTYPMAAILQHNTSHKARTCIVRRDQRSQKIPGVSHQQYRVLGLDAAEIAGVGALSLERPLSITQGICYKVIPEKHAVGKGLVNQGVKVSEIICP